MDIYMGGKWLFAIIFILFRPFVLLFLKSGWGHLPQESGGGGGRGPLPLPLTTPTNLGRGDAPPPPISYFPENEVFIRAGEPELVGIRFFLAPWSRSRLKENQEQKPLVKKSQELEPLKN